MDLERSLITEKDIERDNGFNLVHPIRVFNLKSLGIDQDELLKELMKTFHSLEWDRYDLSREKMDFLVQHLPDQEAEIKKVFEREYGADIGHPSEFSVFAEYLSSDVRAKFLAITPDRQRSMATFRFFSTEGIWQCERLIGEELVQRVGVGDFRNNKRRFPEISHTITNHPEFKKLLNCITDTVLSLEPKAQEIKMTVHQVGIVARPGEDGTNSREGIHQDGASYIISALVIERRGITGGVSIVYGPDKQTVYLERALAPGEGLFQADSGSPLWHYVTPIRYDNRSEVREGFRCILGFDIYVTKS